MKDLRVALVVPDLSRTGTQGNHREEILRKTCQAGEIDLVVYPEAFFHSSKDDAVNMIRGVAENFRKPVLAGIETPEGFQIAVYVNPNPIGDETTSHLYVKHSTAKRLAFEWKGYKGREDPMFNPIAIGDHRFGVMICHDMFYGLITDIFMEKKVTGLFDLTGSDVQLKKWKSILQARSIEIGGPFFCTMAKRKEGGTGKAAAIAYHDGIELTTQTNHLNPDGAGGFSVFPMSTGRGSGTQLLDDHNFSNQCYNDPKNDIQFSLGDQPQADIQVKIGQEVKGRNFLKKSGHWSVFNLPAGRTGVLTLPLNDIRNPRRLYELLPPNGAFAHHIVVYCASGTPTDRGRILAIARLRATEHRIAVGIFAGEMKEFLKTDNYKHIQRFNSHSGVFGINNRNLGGTRSGCSPGIPEEQVNEYLRLVGK